MPPPLSVTLGPSPTIAPPVPDKPTPPGSALRFSSPHPSLLPTHLLAHEPSASLSIPRRSLLLPPPDPGDAPAALPPSGTHLLLPPRSVPETLHSSWSALPAPPPSAPIPPASNFL